MFLMFLIQTCLLKNVTREPLQHSFEQDKLNIRKMIKKESVSKIRSFVKNDTLLMKVTAGSPIL